MIENEDKTMPALYDQFDISLTERPVNPGNRQSRARPSRRPACSHGYVFGDPGGHLCGEMPSDRT
jgi:hypothetical protein